MFDWNSEISCLSFLLLSDLLATGVESGDDLGEYGIDLGDFFRYCTGDIFLELAGVV